MADRQAGSSDLSGATHAQTWHERLRPGAVLAVAVVGVVGLVGIVQWNQRLIWTALIAGAVIFALNAVVVAVRLWHRRNTSLEATYVDAEEFVRLRRPKSR